MKDSFYTPTELATHLTKFVNGRNIKAVADFSVGEGELLRAAELRWPNIKCFGTDISTKAISSIKLSHPKWNLSKCDFLNESSRKKANIFRSVREFDLILLNPPFSCIGGSVHIVELDGIKFNASIAMAFFTESLKYLSKKGRMYAILPNSVAYSQKDRKLWMYLENKYNLLVLEESNTKHFSDCSARIIIVSINTLLPWKKSEITTKKITKLHTKINNLSVFRGKIGMHKVNPASKNGHFLIHSTNLQNNRVENLQYKIDNKLSEIKGPAVLLPRVGVPSKNKICMLTNNEKYVLSDCILAIKTKTSLESTILKDLLIKHIKTLTNLYKGTGAKYITKEKLETFLGLRN